MQSLRAGGRRYILHFHMLFLDGVYVQTRDGALTFRWVKAPTSAELTAVARPCRRRGCRFPPAAWCATN